MRLTLFIQAIVEMKKTILLTLFLYSFSLFVFFSSDDWFHLRVSDITSISEFINFFSFSKTPQSIAFYRPLPTQVFFSVFDELFGLNPVPYHLFVLAVFSLSLYLLFKLSTTLGLSEKKALIATAIYGFSVSNFTRLYFLSAFQEVALVAFSLACILSFLNGRLRRSLLFFVLALLSKETAVVLPLILLVLGWVKGKTKIIKLLPYAAILLPYLYLRLFWFGLASGDTYTWDFSPIKAANTLMWYVLWSIGAPELLVDYIGSGLRPIARFYSDFPAWWWVILGLLAANLLFYGYLVIKNIKKVDRKLTSLALLFLVSLLPVLFLPQHKFALELGLPLVWFSLAVSYLLPERGRFVIVYLILFLLLNLSMNYLTYFRHYSVGRGKITRTIYDYFSSKYPVAPENAYFEFINDSADYGQSWGSSRQIANSTGGSEMFRVIYRDPTYNVYFEDLPGARPEGKQRIPLSTKMFLQ